jgi:ATP-binding cassette subfamily A (ABC1) protein 3
LKVWYDSGSILPRNFRKARTKDSGTTATANAVISRPDVEAEARAVAQSEDALRVMRVSKTFEGKTVVDDVSFAVSTGTILSLLGPNGAGKTTTFNMVRGDIIPTTGQILIQGKSAVSQPRAARLHLGVCPQFTAIDAQLTVREHLDVYGRLKGLNPGPELRSNVDQILKAAGLESYRDREASRLSGGNQRKLALAIALMGNPSVVLIDEFVRPVPNLMPLRADLLDSPQAWTHG